MLKIEVLGKSVTWKNLTEFSYVTFLLHIFIQQTHFALHKKIEFEEKSEKKLDTAHLQHLSGALNLSRPISRCQSFLS